MHGARIKLARRGGWLPVFLWWALAANALASPAQPSVRFSSVDLGTAGLPQSTLAAIVQDRKGFLWVGTRDGLSRYDGYRFKNFRHDPRDPDSLSGSFVYTLHVDRTGALWVGTYAHGLNRFDAGSERFERFVHDPDDEASLGDNGVMCLLEDRDGTLWVGTRAGGLNRFDRQTGTFQRCRHEPDDPDGATHPPVRCALEDREGRIWLGLWGGGLRRFDRESGEFAQFRHDPDDPGSLGHNVVSALAEDADGFLWVATMGGGLNRLDPREGRFVRYPRNPARPELGPNADMIYTLLLDRQGSLWLGTYDNGLGRFDPKTGRFDHFPPKPGDPTALGSNWVRSLWQGRSGELWVGLDSGLHKLERGKGFLHYRHDSRDPESLAHNQVRAIYEDAAGALWVGTNHGLDRLDRPTGKFRHYRHDPRDPDSLGHDRILTIHGGADGALWIGSAGGGLNRFDPETERFRRYLHDPKDAGGIASDIAYPVLVDRQGAVWVGTDGRGLDAFDPVSGTFRHHVHDPDDDHSLSHNLVYGAFEDSEGVLWFGSANGLNRLDRRTGRFTRFFHDPGNPSSLSDNTVFCFYERRPGELWVGTDGGLDLMDGEGRFLDHYGRERGFPNETIHGILSDERDRLWLSCNRGLIRLDPETGEVRTYDVHDGLQANEFLRRCYFKSASGELFFGGVNGFNAFRPETLTSDRLKPPVAITEFLLFNRPAPLERFDPESRLQASIAETEALTLTHDDQVFAFEFAALHYVSPDRNRYAYKLENFDQDWIETSAANRLATYTNIGPGRYLFRVKAANGDGVWNETGASIAIRMLPPWHRSLPAYGLYIAVLAGLAAVYLRAQKRKLAKERAVNERLRQVDRLKDQLLANVSHELRTPLNGIVGLVEALGRNPSVRADAPLAEDLGMITLSGKRLGHVVDNLLDYARIRSHSVPCRLGPASLYDAVASVFDLCRPLAEEKGVALINACPLDLPPAMADEALLRQALYNLVDNAVKFTDEGWVRVEAEVVGSRLSARVIDTGSGVPEALKARMFKAFEQGDGSIERLHSGVGLGLAVAQGLIALQGGVLEAGEPAGRGSVFCVDLPRCEDVAGDRGPEAEAEPRVADPGPPEQGDASPAPPRAHILIVDDDRVNRRVARRFLEKDRYRLSEAEDGPQALRLLREDPSVDLVLLDIMMPRMSGFEVCRALRRELGKKNLPVIFLSAKTSPEAKAEALAAGGDEILPKPIERDLLLARIRARLQALVE